MLRSDRLTLKAAEVVQRAVAMATDRGNPVVNDAHLFAALLADDEGIVVPILQKAGVNVTELRTATESELDRLPKQTGAGQGQPQAARELMTLSRLRTNWPPVSVTPSCRPSIC